LAFSWQQNPFSSIPFYPLISQKRRAALERDFEASGIPIPASQFLNIAFSICLSFSLLLFASLLVYGFTPIFSSSISLVIFCSLSLISLHLPKSLSAMRAKSLEGELPMLLGEFSVYLKLRMPFEKAMMEISHARYASSPIFSKALRAIHSGSSVQAALLDAARQVRSRHFIRAIHQLIVEYEEGSAGESLSLLSEEISQAKQAQAKENGSKAALFGLFYISCAALLPSFFSILSVASSAMSNPMKEADVWIFFLIACPLANSLCLLLIWLNSSEQPPDSQQANAGAQAHSNAALQSQPSAPISIFFIACAIAAAFLLSFSSAGILAAILIAALPHLPSGISSMRMQKREEEIDAELPLSLMAASSQARGFSIEKALATMEKSSQGPLAQELSSITRQANSGVMMQQALSEAANGGRGSWLFGRAMSILLSAYRSGSAMSSAVRHTSKCMLSMLSLIQERRAALSLQRYTLLFACLAVPAIIASVLSVSSEISSTFSSMPEGFFMQPQANSASLAAASLAAAQIYLAIFSLLTAAFISLQEGKRGAFAFHASVLLALTQLAFIASLNFLSLKTA